MNTRTARRLGQTRVQSAFSRATQDPAPRANRIALLDGIEDQRTLASEITKPAAPIIPHKPTVRPPNKTRLEIAGEITVGLLRAIAAAPGAVVTAFHQHVWCPHKHESVSRSDSSKVKCHNCGRRRNRTYRYRT